ncbi:MAG: hypothetical protein WB341_15250 [Terracidiphilus sp.]
MMPLNALRESSDMVAMGERVHYLSLALDARRALNAIRAADKGKERTEELRDSIRAATASLEILRTHADLYARHSPEHYVQYEEVQTLREVSSSLEPEPLIQSLKSLLSDEAERPSLEDLNRASTFFRALESRALHHYDDPASGDTFMV